MEFSATVVYRAWDIQDVPGGMCETSSVPYVKIYRYNPKHLCPKLNGYGDIGETQNYGVFFFFRVDRSSGLVCLPSRHTLHA
jgi:hypothetical protein